MYYFEVFNPRPTREAEKHNNAIFRKGPVLGIEVAIPELADRCFYNIDPQHGISPKDCAAIQEAVIYNPLPAGGTVLATVKTDLDSVGSMALIDIRSRQESLKSLSGRVALVAKSDKFERGDWPGVTELPGMDGNNLWPHPYSRLLNPIAMYIGNSSIPIKFRVIAMKEWFKTGAVPDGYEEKAIRERIALARALELKEIKHSVHYSGQVCFVESMLHSATEVGYSRAPVVVTLNPKFPLPHGEEIRKFTICAYNDTYADIPGALADLAKLERGWNGSKTIGGSSQTKSSELEVITVLSVVSNHLKK